MNQVGTRTALFAVALAFTATAAVAPVAQAYQANVETVGAFFVNAAGEAMGANVHATIDETRGTLTDVKSVALGADVFRSVTIDGFSQVEKIRGVGSSQLLLSGSNALVSLHDDANMEFSVLATSATSVRYALPFGVDAEQVSDRVVAVVGPDGVTYGHLVALAPADAAATLSAGFSAVESDLDAGARVVWQAQPSYVTDPAYLAATVAALADGALAAKVVTAFAASTDAVSLISYAPDVTTRVTEARDYAFETVVSSRAAAARVVAFDLAYEALPANAAGDVAFFVDGFPAPRVAHAADVAAAAARGEAAFHAVVEDGRTQVLAATSSFTTAPSHRLALVAGALGSSELEARAASLAEASRRATGSFALSDSGRLTGAFTASVVDAEAFSITDFTALGSRTEVFRSVSLDGVTTEATASVEGHAMVLTSDAARFTLVDDRFTTFVVDAFSDVDAAFALADGVTAVPDASGVLHVAAPHGVVGKLIVARADPTSAAFTVTGSDVTAHLDAGSRLVFRAADSARLPASEGAVAAAIASGDVGAQILAGFSAGDATAHAVAYSDYVEAAVVDATRGAFTIDYTPRLPPASSFVFDARGTALAAKTAHDVRVLVDGTAATPVASAAAAFAPGHGARYFVDATLASETRVIVNTAGVLAQTARVVIESRLDDAARASANTDAFGAFRLFTDGTAVGSFVSLVANRDAGVVNDFTLLATGETVFSGVTAGASAFAVASGDGASVLRLVNDQADLSFTDTTSGFVRIVARDATQAGFRLAPGVSAVPAGGNVVELSNSAGAHVGSLIVTDVAGKAAQSTTFLPSGAGEVRAALEPGYQLLFRTHVGVERELADTQRTMINHAIAAGDVAGHVLVQSEASLASLEYAAQAAAGGLEATTAGDPFGSATAFAAYAQEGLVTSAVTSAYFNDVQMVTAATQDRVDITVSSATSLGKTIIVSLDAHTLSGLSTGDAEILVDGLPVAQASSYADILNPNDDLGVAEYLVLAGDAGTQVLVSLPHFSTHSVTLKERDAAAPPIFLYATMFLGVLVVAETAMLVRKRAA